MGRGGGGSQHLGLSTWVLQGAGSADGRAHPCRALGHSGAQKSHSRRGQAARLCSRDSRFKAGSGRRWARETVRMGALNKTAISSEMSFRGFPGGPVVRTLRFHCRGHGFKPWSGKIPRAAERLSPYATATEARAPENPCSAVREATAMRSPRTAAKRSPRSPQLEKARAQQRRPNACSQKII